MSEAAIVGLLVRFVANVISWQQLEMELPDGWELDQRDDAAARSLALAAMAYLAEFENGDRDAPDLREAIRSLILDRSPTEALVATVDAEEVPSPYFAQSV